MIFISPNSRVYIACPAVTATGGTELLHQLCDQLNSNKINAFMYYFDQKPGLPDRNDAFARYDSPKSEKIDDSHNNYLIVPEVAVYLLNNFDKCAKIVWWLSVDNFLKSPGDGFSASRYLKRNLIKLGLYNNLSFFNNLDESVIHFSQSYYAYDFLIKHGIKSNNIHTLSDYINEDFFRALPVDRDAKRDKVLYNPSKGYEFTRKLIESSPDLDFIPLANMNRAEMIQCMSEAKVYVDFGNHPGKDRIPREAAILDLCIITSKNGSAAFYEDVSIPEAYKFSAVDSDIPEIKSLIHDCFADYKSRINDFEGYRRNILRESELFNHSVVDIFCSND